MTKIHTIDLYFLLIVLISSPFAFCSDIRELSTLNGPTIARFDRPLEQLSLPKGRQYGIFRALEPTRKQNIVEQWRVEKLPGLGGKTGSLVLKYTVNEGYNGWWLKLAPDGKIADWSKFEKGHLIIRVLDAPRQFKVELKDRFLAIYPVVVRLRREHFEKINERGYVDIVIPLKSFRIPNMNGLRELVIVFESFRLAPEYSGELSMCEIGISNKPELTANADEILNDLRKRAFAWFMKYKHPTTGLVLDRGPNRENTHPNPQKPAMCSVASVGYFLSLLPE